MLMLSRKNPWQQIDELKEQIENVNEEIARATQGVDKIFTDWNTLIEKKQQLDEKEKEIEDISNELRQALGTKAPVYNIVQRFVSVRVVAIVVEIAITVTLSVTITIFSLGGIYLTVDMFSSSAQPIDTEAISKINASFDSVNSKLETMDVENMDTIKRLEQAENNLSLVRDHFKTIIDLSKRRANE